MSETNRCMKWFSMGVGVLSIILTVALTGSAQTGTGTIAGTVSDPQGLAMVNVTVVVLDVDTGQQTTSPTNSAGLYSAPSLQPGDYEVTATKSGFETVVDKGIVLHVGEIVTVDIQMPIQAQQGNVTVTEQAPVLDTEKTEQSQTVSQALVAGLPINGRRWEDFVLLTPAVTTDGTSGLSSFRGISGLYNGNLVDGANNMQAFFSEARGRAIIVAYVYSADSVREFQVNNSNYSAEFGQAAGGVVNAVTRSGTNDLHGDLFYNLRYPSLNALDPAAKASFIGNGQTPTQTVHQQQQFGGSFGAPLIKNKLFIFGTYDGFRKVNPILYFTTAGTISNFACPTQATATECSAAQTYITTDLLGAFPRDLKQNVGLGKLDYQVTTNNHLSGVFNLQDWDEPDGYNTSATVSNAGVTVNGFGATHERFAIGTWTSTIGSNKVNDVRFQWGRDYEYDKANASGPFVSLSSIVTYGETSALPRPAFPDEHRYQISDDFTIQEGTHSFKMGVDANFIHELLVNLFQGDGSYSYSSSDATLPASVGATCLSSTVQKEFCGWIADLFNINLGDTYSVTTGDSASTGTFCVPTVPLPAAPTAATCWSMTGRHYGSFTQVVDPITHVGADDFYDDDYGAYLQDTWKVRGNLTLNLGLRYDIQRVPPPPNPNNSTNNPNTTPLLTLYTSTLNLDKNNIAPRIGVAWQINSKTVLRAGYGIFYGKTSNSTYYALRVENGIYQQTFSGCVPTSKTVALAACSPNFPDVYFVPPGPALAASVPGSVTPVAVCTTTNNPGAAPSCPTLAGQTLPTLSQAVHGMTPDFVNPAAHEGELTIERELPGKMTVSATYLLTRGLHIPADYDANIAPSATNVEYDVLNSAGSLVLTTAPIPFYNTRLNPTTGIILNQESVVNSWYNGLVLSVHKPLSNDVELLFNYTYSKALDDGEISGGTNSEGDSGTFYGNDGVSDPYNLHTDYSYSDLDQRHRFVGSIVWTPNYAHGMSSAFARQLLDGWAVSTIITASTGLPYSATIGGSTLGNGGVDGGLTGGVVGTNASAINGRALWLARNSYSLPTWANMDFRLARAFTIHEKYSLEFRAEAFNLFNSALVQDVNSEGYTFTAASASAASACYTGTHPGVSGCFVPFPAFQTPTTTSGVLYGARQMQLGFRFGF